MFGVSGGVSWGGPQIKTHKGRDCGPCQLYTINNCAVTIVFLFCHPAILRPGLSGPSAEIKLCAKTNAPAGRRFIPFVTQRSTASSFLFFIRSPQPKFTIPCIFLAFLMRGFSFTIPASLRFGVLLKFTKSVETRVPPTRFFEISDGSASGGILSTACIFYSCAGDYLLPYLTLGDRWRPRKTKKEGEKVVNIYLWSTWYKEMEKKNNARPNVGGVVSFRSGNGAPSRKRYVVNDHMSNAKYV